MTLKPLPALLLAASLSAASLSARAQQAVPLTPQYRTQLETEMCVGNTKHRSCAISFAVDRGWELGQGIACGLRIDTKDDFKLPVSLIFVLAHDKTDWERAYASYKLAIGAGTGAQLNPSTAIPCAPLLARFESVRSAWKMKTP